MDPERNEYELALRARDGDRDALAELVECTRLRLFALAYAELRHYADAQDAVAAALLQICRHVGELRQPERIRAWMQSIVRNEAHRLRRGADTAVVGLDEVGAPMEGAGLSLLRLDIDRALRHLPRNQAQAIRLFYLDDMSLEEIAQLLGRSRGTIGSWLHRGRQRLAMHMEGYAPMTSRKTGTAMPAAPSQTAALIQSDLEPVLVQKITDTLRTAGYVTKIITHGDFPHLAELLKECQAIILDEGSEGRSALEYLIHLREMPETREIPVNVLCTDPSEFTISAYFLTGVARLIHKEDPNDLDRLARQLELSGFWRQFTERARKAVFAAQEEVVRRGEDAISDEGLLLGLVRDEESVASRLLSERLDISLDAIRSPLEERAKRGSGSAGREPQLTPSAKRVIDLADEEARRLGDNYLGTEHLLLGFLREGYGPAARILIKLGADLESVRREIEAMRSH